MDNFSNSYEKETPQAAKVNPFTAVWLHPKRTARYMIDAKSIGYAIFILSIGYIGSLLSGVMGTGLSVWGILLLCLVLAPIVGLIGTSISALITLLVGKLFKGAGTFSELFKALSLTAIPFIVLIPFYLIWLFISPETLLVIDYAGPLPLIFWVANFATIVICIWSFVICIAAVAEAHQISNWKAFFTLFIPGVIIGLVFLVIAIVIVAGIVSMGGF